MACRSQAPRPEVLVTGVDYAFQLPDTLPPGPVVIRFRNAGKVSHEMGLALLKSGVTFKHMTEVMGAGGSPDSLLESTVGILIAEPGQTTLGALTTDLLPGRTYVFGCMFQDGPDKPPHAMLGMISPREIGPAPR